MLLQEVVMNIALCRWFGISWLCSFANTDKRFNTML